MKEMIEKLSQIKGAKFIGITSSTPVKGHKDIFKIADHNVQVNYSYENAVVNALTKENKTADAYEPGTTWSEMVLDSEGRITPFAENPKTGEKYLRCRLLNSKTQGYKNLKTGEIFPSDYPLFKGKKTNSKNQGLDNPIKVRTFKLENVLEIRVDKEVIRGG